MDTNRVGSGVSQGSVLGSILFTIFIDDIDEGRRVNTHYYIRSMQRILDKFTWANSWDLDFNVSKCIIMHIGKMNLEFQYQMNDGWGKSLDNERDLGVLKSQNNVYWQNIKLI